MFHELFVSDQSDDRNDDLLFFVQRVSDEVENGGLGVDPVFVKRKVKGTDGRDILTPEQEDVVLWKDTFFLNVIVQVPFSIHFPLSLVVTFLAEPLALTPLVHVYIFIESSSAS